MIVEVDSGGKMTGSCHYSINEEIQVMSSRTDMNIRGKDARSVWTNFLISSI